MFCVHLRKWMYTHSVNLYNTWSMNYNWADQLNSLVIDSMTSKRQFGGVYLWLPCLQIIHVFSYNPRRKLPVAYLLQKLLVRLHTLTPGEARGFSLLKHHSSIFQKVFPKDKQLLAASNIAWRQRFFANLRHSRRLSWNKITIGEQK